MFQGPSDILHLVVPGGLPPRAIFATFLLIQGSPAKSPLVKCKDGNVVLRELGMYVVVSSHVFCETVNKDENCFRLQAGIGSGVELRAVRTCAL